MRAGAAATLLLAMLALAPAWAAPDDERAPGAPAPAQVAGLWCGTGPLHEFSLEIAQSAEAVEGKLRRKQRERLVSGRVAGNTVVTETHQKVGGLVLEAVGDQLHVTGGSGPLALLRGQAFARARGDSCTG